MQYFTFRHLGDAPDGSPRMLGFDMNSIADLELEMGDGNIYKILQNKAGFNFIRHVVWAGLKWQDRTLTPAAVGELIQEHVINKGRSLSSITEPVMEALQKSGVFSTGKTKEARPTNGATEKAAPKGKKGKAETPAPA